MSFDNVLAELGKAVAVFGVELVEIYFGLGMPVGGLARPFAGISYNLAEHHI